MSIARHLPRAAVAMGIGASFGCSLSSDPASCETTTTTTTSLPPTTAAPDASCETTTTTTTTTTTSLPPTTAAQDDQYQKSLRPYLPNEAALRKQWEQDEEGFRNLPARAWPPRQPDIEEIPGLEQQFQHQCHTASLQATTLCQDLKFLLATAFVFNNFSDTEDGKENITNRQKGFDMYLSQSNTHPDSMCAAGIILVEGLGRKVNEEKGLELLNQAYTQHQHAQSMYELGTAYYTGLEEYLEEDEPLAYAFFNEASALNHYGGMYMAADCLMEGVGTNVDVKRAVPMLFEAADSGHRFARQKCRELFSKYGEQ